MQKSGLQLINMDRFLKVSELKSLIKEVDKNKISFSKMVEIINYKAQKYYNDNYNSTYITQKK